ncbi:Hypothetical protein PHPALM_5316, partial [Phytophthora palmivora]
LQPWAVTRVITWSTSSVKPVCMSTCAWVAPRITRLSSRLSGKRRNHVARPSWMPLLTVLIQSSTSRGSTTWRPASVALIQRTRTTRARGAHLDLTRGLLRMRTTRTTRSTSLMPKTILVSLRMTNRLASPQLMTLPLRPMTPLLQLMILRLRLVTPSLRLMMRSSRLMTASPRWMI